MLSSVQFTGMLSKTFTVELRRCCYKRKSKRYTVEAQPKKVRQPQACNMARMSTMSDSSSRAPLVRNGPNGWRSAPFLSVERPRASSTPNLTTCTLGSTDMKKAHDYQYKTRRKPTPPYIAQGKGNINFYNENYSWFL